MTDTTPTEEQTKLTALVGRYAMSIMQIFNIPFILVMAFSISSLYLLLRFVDVERSPLWAFLIPLVWLGSTSAVGMWLAHRFMLKKFLRTMTPEERVLLETPFPPEVNKAARGFLKHLTKAYHKVNPQTEYLRASQPFADNTLLRAANHIDTTSQDELLRASSTEETPERLTYETAQNVEEPVLLTQRQE